MAPFTVGGITACRAWNSALGGRKQMLSIIFRVLSIAAPIFPKVNTYSLVNKNVKPEHREFSMGVVCIADSFGISLVRRARW